MKIIKTVIGTKENKNGKVSNVYEVDYKTSKVTLSSVRDAKKHYAITSLLGSSTKVEKGLKKGYLTKILYLSPQKLSGLLNTCANASKGCVASCLNTSGFRRYDNTQLNSLRKTYFFYEQKELFFEMLKYEIEMLKLEAMQENLIPCIRLNGVSDIPFENMKYKTLNNLDIYRYFHDVQFYEYTKNANKFLSKYWKTPKNLHLTFSKDETNEKKAIEILNLGYNVAYVFRLDKKVSSMPKTWNFYNVECGNETDLRFTDTKAKKGEKGVIISLKATGKAQTDKTGFVIRLSEMNKELLNSIATF